MCIYTKILSFLCLSNVVRSKDVPKYKDLRSWSCAIGYGLGSGSPLSPSFNFGLELAKNSQVSSFHELILVVILPINLFLFNGKLHDYLQICIAVHCLVLSTCGGPKTSMTFAFFLSVSLIFLKF